MYDCHFLNRGTLHSPTQKGVNSPEESQEQLEKVDGMYSTKHKAFNLTSVFSDTVHP